MPGPRVPSFQRGLTLRKGGQDEGTEMPLSELPVNRETHSQATTWLLPELFGEFIIISKKNNPIFQMFITGRGWWWRCGDETGTGKSRVSEVHCLGLSRPRVLSQRPRAYAGEINPPPSSPLKPQKCNQARARSSLLQCCCDKAQGSRPLDRIRNTGGPLVEDLGLGSP